MTKHELKEVLEKAYEKIRDETDYAFPISELISAIDTSPCEPETEPLFTYDEAKLLFNTTCQAWTGNLNCDKPRGNTALKGSPYEKPCEPEDCKNCSTKDLCKPSSESEYLDRPCEYCGGKISIRNPTGNCDHLYYPENVNKALKPSENTGNDELHMNLKEALGTIETLEDKLYNATMELEEAKSHAGDMEGAVMKERQVTEKWREGARRLAVMLQTHHKWGYAAIASRAELSIGELFDS